MTEGGGGGREGEAEPLGVTSGETAKRSRIVNAKNERKMSSQSMTFQKFEK